MTPATWLLSELQAAAMSRVRDSLGELAAIALPGSGSTWSRWRHLQRLAHTDLSVARLSEGHLDAIAILHELDRSDLIDRSALWGVWAAEPSRLVAAPTGAGWHLRGVKQWCSGSAGLDRALVTAIADDGPRLFAVCPGEIGFDPDSWAPIGMAATASHTAVFDLEVAGDQVVGVPSAYTQRPGFGHGGAGVAACWLGGAVAVFEDVTGDENLAPSTLADVGVSRSSLEAATSHLRSIADRFDTDPTDRLVADRWAVSARLVVEACGRAVLELALRTAGSDGLCHQAGRSGRIADLAVYLSQLRADRAAAAYAFEPDGWLP